MALQTPPKISDEARNLKANGTRWISGNDWIITNVPTFGFRVIKETKFNAIIIVDEKGNEAKTYDLLGIKTAQIYEEGNASVISATAGEILLPVGYHITDINMLSGEIVLFGNGIVD